MHDRGVRILGFLGEGELHNLAALGIQSPQQSRSLAGVPYVPVWSHGDSVGTRFRRRCGVVDDLPGGWIEMTDIAVPLVGVPHSSVAGHGGIMRKVAGTGNDV